MRLAEWILAALIILLIWGNLSKKSRRHPLNSISINPRVPLCSTQSTVGDNFNSGNAIVSGVTEPAYHCCHRVVGVFTGNIPRVPVHVALPVNPPPIAIQTPKPPVSVAKPPTSTQLKPPRTVISTIPRPTNTYRAPTQFGRNAINVQPLSTLTPAGGTGVTKVIWR